MDRKRNKLCIAAGVVSLFTALMYLITTIELFADDAEKLLREALELQTMTMQEFLSLLTFMRVYFVISTVVSLFFALLFIVIGCLKKPVNKTLLVISAVIVTLCGGGIVTLILLICAICHNPQPVYNAPQNPVNVNVEPPNNAAATTMQATTKAIEEKIKQLKQLKEEGSISEEEYNELLKSLFK